MKQTSLIVSLLIASIAGSNAQNVREVLNVSLPYTDHAIVRTDDIAYYEISGQGYFAYLNSFGGTYYTVGLPAQWSIWDFRVLDKIVYFCGKDNSTNKALLGDFHIGPLVSNNGTVTFNYDTNICTEFAVLNRLAVSEKKGTVSLVAIGQTVQNIDPNRYGANMILYYDDYSSTTALMYDEPDKVFWDVVATGTTYAVAGTKTSFSQQLYLYSFPIGTPISTFSCNQYEYNCPRNFVSGIRATLLEKDSLALASYYYDAYTGSCGLQVFSASSLSGHIKHDQYYQYPSNSIVVPPISAPKEMVFLPDSDFLMITDTILYNQHLGDVSIIRLNAYPPDPSLVPYYGVPRFTPDMVSGHITSLANYTPLPNHFIAASGADWTTFNMSSIIYPYYLYIQHCFDSYMVDMFLDDEISGIKNTIENGRSYIKDMRIKTKEVNTEGARANCVNSFPPK